MKRGRSLGFVVVHTPPRGTGNNAPGGRLENAVIVVGGGIVLREAPMDRALAERTAHSLQAERKDPFYQIAELVLPSEPEVEI